MIKGIRFLLIILVGVVACNGDATKEVKDSTSSCKTNSLNPNGDSELALLMRKMAAFTDSVKQDLIHKRAVRPKLENIGTILTAKKTDEGIDKAVFTPLAQNYIFHVEQFYAAAPEEQTEAFNNMVSACISCHENFCGGPIKRIQKLFLPKE